ncbi:MAG: histidine kinase [Chitinophagaceae bacterium]|nr:MAG: histidine kinase [Chitinophagaceae bacterium]
MNLAIKKDRFRLYLFIGLAWFVIWELTMNINFAGQVWPRTINEIWRNIYITILNFTCFEYVVPFIGRKRKNIFLQVILGVFFLWVAMMFYSFGLYAWRQLGILLGLYTPFLTISATQYVVKYQMSYAFSSIFFYGIISHIYNYIQLKQTTQKLRFEKQQAELSFLKSQTNPHFLFNTLNNIYSLARDKSDLAPESILRLSKILRFMLYETSGNYISIEQELKIIGDYISLEQLRYDESLRISLNHDVEELKQSVPPLLLMPLVENSFKHGVSETRGLPFIDIQLSVKNRQLSFVVKNSSESATEDDGVKENIGLSNLRRQLELLYKDFGLDVRQSDGVFTAALKINLGSHV